MPIDHDHRTARQFVPIVRERYRGLTAFRIGFLVGSQPYPDEWACPYPDERGRHLFAVGVESGRQWRHRAIEQGRDPDALP